MAVSVLLLIVLYYLGDDGQASFFPSYLATLACLPLLAMPGSHRAPLRDSRFLIALALITWLGSSPLWSGDFDWRYPGYAILLATFIAAVVMANRRYPSLIDWIVMVMILSAALSATISIYLFYFVDYNPLIEKDRLYALGRNYQPTVSAISYSVPLIMAFTRLSMRRHLAERALYTAMVVALAWAIALSGTRGAWAGLIAATLASAFVLTNAGWRTRGLLAGAIMVGFVVAIGIAMALGLDDFILRRSTSFRPEIWGATLDRMTGGNWLIGNGINASASVSWRHLTFDHAHSIYLSTLFLGGIIGLGLLLALLLTSGLPLLRSATSERHAIAFATLAFAIVTLAVDGDRLVAKVDHLWIVFWFPLLFAWIAFPRARHDSNAGE